MRSMGLPWNERVPRRSSKWRSRRADVGARPGLPVGRGDMLECSWRPPAVLQWARARAAHGTSGRAEAAEGGHLAALQWARAQGCPWTGIRRRAAEGGHLEVLQWARCSGLPMGRACAPSRLYAATSMCRSGRALRAAWDKWTCARALGNHLAVLQWARAQGCPWDKYTCTYAASNGHLAVLQGARSGLPWDERMCAYAASDGHLEVLQWATLRAAHGTSTRARTRL